MISVLYDTDKTLLAVFQSLNLREKNALRKFTASESFNNITDEHKIFVKSIMEHLENEILNLKSYNHFRQETKTNAEEKRVINRVNSVQFT